MERANTLEERKQQARDRHFNIYFNKPARITVLKKLNDELKKELAK
jgi:hypothetical protein